MIRLKRALLAGCLFLGLPSPLAATTLLKATITTAVTAAVSSTLQVNSSDAVPASAAIQGNFVYGSGGTTADAWVQTSLDGGSTWTDVANFHYTTSSARFQFNLSSLTPVTTEYTPTDGTLAANTAKDGVFGSQWRVKYTTTGAYAGGTTMQIDIITKRLTQ